MKLGPCDGWMLLSICACRQEGGTFRDIISVADYINHAIIKRDEMFSSIKRLHRAGFIYQRGNRFRPTRRVAVAYSRISKEKKQYMKMWGSLEAYLESAKEKEPIGNLFGLTKKAYDKALKDYLDNF